jgi:hypothetical protein
LEGWKNKTEAHPDQGQVDSLPTLPRTSDVSQETGQHMSEWVYIKRRISPHQVSHCDSAARHPIPAEISKMT